MNGGFFLHISEACYGSKTVIADQNSLMDPDPYSGYRKYWIWIYLKFLDP
jgi:hypothetical protein